MAKYIGRRLLHLVGILIAVSFLTFLLMYLSPGDAAMKKLNAQGVAVSDEIIEKTRESMGLDRPFLVQYGDWALHALRFDLGESYKDGFPVAEKLVKALRYTAILALGSLALAFLVALPLAILTALHKDSLLDDITRLFSFCLALSIPICGRFIRQFRAEILEQLGKPYVSGARLRGVKERYVLKNVLHNASISILTIVGLSIGTLFGGSVVIETIFRWPGLGKLAMDAISNRDYPVIQGFVLFTSTVYVVINLLIDICYAWVDPRLRRKGGGA